MKQPLLCVLLLSAALLPAPLAAQSGLTAPPPTPSPSGRNSVGFTLQMVDGQPIETRGPELAGDKPAFPGQTRAPYHKSVDYSVTTIAEGFNFPWSLAFLPDGKYLVSEKPGGIRIVGKDGSKGEPLKNVPAVSASGQVGQLDVVLDKNFASNHRIFFSYSEPRSDTDSGITLATAKLDEAGNALQDVKVIFQAPALPKTRSANQGGRIAIDPKDGSIFMTVGDRSQSPPWLMAQQLDNTFGKVIHVTADGKPGPGNPFVGKDGAKPEIWSLGHRSEEGLAFDPNGKLWETEHGPRGGDELNTPQAGLNYGWPVIVHGIDYPGDKIDDGITQKIGMQQPQYYWDPVIAPSGLAFYKGNLFPAWKGSVFVGALRGMMLDRLTLNGDDVVSEEPLLADLKARIRDVRVKDGAVYVLTDGKSANGDNAGKLLKLTPKK